jgi:hypothetical protein
MSLATQEDPVITTKDMLHGIHNGRFGICGCVKDLTTQFTGRRNHNESIKEKNFEASVKSDIQVGIGIVLCTVNQSICKNQTPLFHYTPLSLSLSRFFIISLKNQIIYLSNTETHDNSPLFHLPI